MYEKMIVTYSKQSRLFMAIEALLLSLPPPSKRTCMLEIPMPIRVNINVPIWETA
jgi:hypothetical protein